MKLTIKMRRWGLMGLLSLLLAAVLVLPQIIGVSAWSGDSTVNTPICTDVNNQDSPQIISDGAGGAIITWEDNRGSDSDIYVQRANDSGTPQWNVGDGNGSVICNESGDQEYPQIISDGAGGAIITWQDYRNGSEYDIYAQRVNESGVVQWTGGGGNGSVICNESGNQYAPQITSDGVGGAIITWEDYRNASDGDIYAQWVNESGVVQWAGNGSVICNTSNDQYSPRITSDNARGAIVTWVDYRSGSEYDIYAQWVNESGVVQWTGDGGNGSVICNESGDQDSIHIISDNARGAIVTWEDSRSGSDDDIYAQRVNESGVVQWAGNGSVICNTSNDQDSIHIISDNARGAIITWEDYRSGIDDDIYAQRVNESGVVQWTWDGGNGSVICNESGNQEYPQIISDGAGGAIITWEDARSGSEYDIYAQRVNESGVVQWAGNGSVICNASDDQEYPQITSDNARGAIITWVDARSGIDNDIYAQWVNPNGSFSDTYNLSTSSSVGGSVSTPGAGIYTYPSGKVQSIVATNASCYHFANWSGSGVDAGVVADRFNASTTIHMSDNYSVQANFAINTSTLTYTAVANGSISNPTPQIVNCGSNSSDVTAVPDACYHFVNWNDGVTTATRNDSASANNGSALSWQANFAINTSTLTYTAVANGSISNPTPQIVNCGSNSSDVTAVPDACYHFVNWNDGVATATRNDSASANNGSALSWQANFAINTSTLTYTAVANGSISNPTPQIVNCGSNSSDVTAVPDACYHFVNWNDGVATATRNDSASANNGSALSWQANFAINTSTLTYTAVANGSISNPTPQIVNCGSNSSDVTAVPDACYHFVNWNDGVATATRNDSASANNGSALSWQANFAPTTYTLTTSNTSGGTVTTPGIGPFPGQTCNASVPIVASNYSCYHFVNWTGTGVAAHEVANANASSTTINMSDNYSVTANFAINTYTLTYNINQGGTINGTHTQTVNCSENGSTVTAVTDACHTFVRWSDNVMTASRTDTNVTGNITVTALLYYVCGGGVGYYYPPYSTLNVNILGGSSTCTGGNNGIFPNAFDAASPDGKIAVHIAGGTVSLGSDGQPLTQLTIGTVSSYPPPPDGRTVIAAFDFKPNGATFNPAIQITITYDPNTLPAGTQPSDLVIAFYDPATGWQYVSGIVDPVAHTITYSITHFTVFAVMGAATSSVAPSTTPISTPTTTPVSTLTPTPTPAVTPAVTPTPTSTATPTITPTTTPTPTPTVVHQTNDKDEGLGTWVWIVVGFVVILALVVIIGLVIRRRTTGDTGRSGSEEK